MNKLKAYWLTFSLPVRILACAVAVLAVVVIISSIGASIERRKHEKFKAEMLTVIDTANAKAAGFEADANAANVKAAMLERELARANQALLDANAELQSASQQTTRTRIIYEKAKSSPPPSYITGNPSVDSRELCARLRAAGFECK